MTSGTFHNFCRSNYSKTKPIPKIQKQATTKKKENKKRVPANGRVGPEAAPAVQSSFPLRPRDRTRTQQPQRNRRPQASREIGALGRRTAQNNF
uniref:Uncharacterized protein n=1 Tax=Anguilla anguilla TaxID=7936 RepID=A0A0E9Q0W5_ANGAN